MRTFACTECSKSGNPHHEIAKDDPMETALMLIHCGLCRLSQLPEADGVRVTFKKKVGPELMKTATEWSVDFAALGKAKAL